MEKACTKCTSQRKRNLTLQPSFLGSLLIVIIPKCPFCIMAYSSALTMCGGKSIYLAQNNWLSYVPLLLSVLMIYILIRNYKGQRTRFAIGLAVAGAALLLLVHQLTISPAFYNLGAILLFFAVWLNGSLLSFVREMTRRLKTRQLQWPK